MCKVVVLFSLHWYDGEIDKLYLKPRYSWNTAKIGGKHDKASINRANCISGNVEDLLKWCEVVLQYI